MFMMLVVFLCLFVICGLMYQARGSEAGMARIILGEILNDIRNAIGAHVYSVWKGVHYIRGKAVSIFNPNSHWQEVVRDALTTLSRQWYSLLTDAERAGWNEYAQQLGSASTGAKLQGYRDIMPFSRGVMSGYNAFIAVNALRARCEMAALTAAPLGSEGLGQPTGIVVTYVAGPPKKFTITWVDPVGAVAADRILIWGRSSKIAHAQLIMKVEPGINTADITYLRGASGNSIPVTSDFYEFQLCSLKGTGFRSAGGAIVGYSVPV